jgi:hypothetical protein
MTASLFQSRLWLWTGLALMVIGAIDPLEGSVLIVAGSGLAVVGGFVAHDPQRMRQLLAFTLVAIGVALLFGWSAVGGMGGRTGRSMWWTLTLLPYPVGWVLGLVATIKMIRRGQPPAYAGGQS